MAVKPTSNNIEYVARTYESILSEINDEVREALIEAANKILDSAVIKAPKQTGVLRASGKVIPSEKSLGKGKPKKITVAVSFGGTPDGKHKDQWDNGDTRNLRNGLVTHAALIHETRTPYLLHAEQENAEEVMNIMKKRTQNLIKKYGRSYKKYEIG